MSSGKCKNFWPFKAEYLIIYLNEEYTQTVIGRNKRDYVWIMAHTPFIPESDYRRIVEQAGRGRLRHQADPAGPAAMAGKRNQDS